MQTDMFGLLAGVAVGLIGAVGAPAIAGDVAFEYLLDDGAGNYNIGPSTFDANMTWLNSFTVEPGHDLITTVSVAFGGIDDDDGVLGSDLVTVAVLNDPNNDGDPSDAVLISTGTGVWTDEDPNVFLHYQLDTPARVDGVFFVAVVMDVLERANPARMDPQGQNAGASSWMFYNPELNLTDLGASPYILHMSESPFIGAWMIRATGVGGNACGADLAEPFGTLNFFDVAEFIARFNAQDAGADLAEPFGAWNFFDVAAFMNLYSAGCP